MHRVVKQHMTDFSKQFPMALDESKLFEAFGAYCVLRRHTFDDPNPNDLIYEGEDPGIDSIMILVDDYFVSSVEEFEESINSGRRDKDVLIILTQCKTGTSWDKGEITKFSSAVQDFFSDQPLYPMSEHLSERRDIFDNVIANVGRIRNGKPRIIASFITTAATPAPAESNAALFSLRNNLKSMGYFHDVETSFLGRDEIVELWSSAQGSVEATLPIIASATFPKAPGIEESYIVTVRAKDYINSLLSDSLGNIRKSIFEENVRDFVGLDNEINKEISDTLRDSEKQKMFGILNNGITIISPDIRLQGPEVYISDFQIVNGCQTSNVLFENKENVYDDATLTIKIIETQDPSIVEDIVKSTNRQTKVEDHQFLATLKSMKAIGRYFVARAQDTEQPLFFERRQNQYNDSSVPSIRVFNIRDIARCAGAMFFDRPDLATRYPNRLTGELQGLVFSGENNEEIYYTSAFLYYRLQLHFSNARIDKKYRKMIWHIMMLVKYKILNGKVPQTNSRKIEDACKKIYEFSAKGEESLKVINEICSEFDIDTIDRDALRSQSLTSVLKSQYIKS